MQNEMHRVVTTRQGDSIFDFEDYLGAQVVP
jgi:hypothetical protein